MAISKGFLLYFLFFITLMISGCGTTSVGYRKTEANHQGNLSNSLSQHCESGCTQVDSFGNCISFLDGTAKSCSDFANNLPFNSPPARERAQYFESLSVYSQFAENICGRIEQSSERNQSFIEGQINAELAGFLRQLANVNARAAGRLERDSTQGVLQEQLASVVVREIDCKQAIAQTLLGND